MNDAQLERLTQIRAQADSLGIQYHHRAGVDTIQKLIEKHLDGENALQAPSVPSEKIIPWTEEEFRAEVAKDNKKNVGSLIRCRVQCMNPQKKNWNGEIISVGSAKLGTFKKFIPFNSAEPFHIPKIIYDMMVERKCTVFTVQTNKLGHRTKEGSQINEFVIEVLDPLTPNELSELAKQQAFAAGQGN